MTLTVGGDLRFHIYTLAYRVVDGHCVVSRLALEVLVREESVVGAAGDVCRVKSGVHRFENWCFCVGVHDFSCLYLKYINKKSHQNK